MKVIKSLNVKKIEYLKCGFSIHLEFSSNLEWNFQFSACFRKGYETNFEVLDDPLVLYRWEQIRRILFGEKGSKMSIQIFYWRIFHQKNIVTYKTFESLVKQQYQCWEVLKQFLKSFFHLIELKRRIFQSLKELQWERLKLKYFLLI